MFSTPAASEPAKLGNIGPERLDTNQQTRPLSWGWGRHWDALFWCISGVYNYRASKKSTGGGKGGKGGGSTTIATCDVAGVAGCSTRDYLEAIEVNNEIVWTGTIERDGAHPEHTGDIVVPDVATFRFHWGTETASGDWLVLNSGGEEHPHYRRQPVLEAKGLNCGSSGNVPNIRVLTERAARFGGLLDEGRSREGANPITGLAELIEDDFAGAGMVGIIDVDAAALIATAFQGRTKIVAVPGDPTHTAYMSYISAYLTERQSLGSFLAAVMENFDGWVRRKGEKLELGCFTHGPIDTSGLLELTLHDFVEDPKFPNPAPDAPSVYTDAIVTGPDRDWNMEDSWQSAGNDVARDRIQETRIKTYARPFLITSYQQKEQAQELANFYGTPAEMTSVRCRREKVGALQPGDRFIVNYSPSTVRQVYRVTTRRDAATGGIVELGVIIERGLAPLTYIAPADPAPALPTPPIAVPIVHARMFQLSTLDEPTAVPKVIPLAERPNGDADGFRVHFSSADVTYDPLAQTIDWALRGTISGALTSGTTTFTINVSGLDLELLQAQTAAAQLDDALPLFIDNEMMSIGAATALGGGNFSVTVLRGRQGTSAAAHSSGAECYILPRSEMLVLEHADFPPAGGTRYFKLQTLAIGDELDLAAALKITFTFAAVSIAAPTGISLASGNSTVNGEAAIFFTPDGTPVPGLLVSWTPPADTLVQARGLQRVQWKRTADATWRNAAGALAGNASFISIRPVDVGDTLHVRIWAELNGLTSAITTSGSHVVQGDTVLPSAPAAPLVLARAGFNEISWSAPSDLGAGGEFYVYRNTTNNGATASFLGKTRDLWFDDSSSLTPGQQLWYFVAAEDGSENMGPKSSGSSVTTAALPVNDVTPSNPSAASKVAEAVYDAGDTTVYAKIQMSVPALPSNAIRQELLAGLVNDPEKASIVWPGKNTGTETPWIENLAPGVPIYVWSRAWSASKVSSTVAATSSPFTPPNKTSDPQPPSLGSFTAGDASGGFRPPPRIINGTLSYACTLNFSLSPSHVPHYGFYQVYIGTDSDSAASLIVDSVGSLFEVKEIGGQAICYIYQESLSGTKVVRVRFFGSWDGGSRVSSWYRVGDASSYLKRPTGDLVEQSKSDLQVSAVKTGDTGASSVRQVRTRYPFVDRVYSFTGGAPTETFTLDISNRGFVATPDAATVQCVDPAGDMEVAYDWANGSNSSSTIYLKAYTKDGSNIGAGPRRFAGEVVEYN